MSEEEINKTKALEDRLEKINKLIAKKEDSIESDKEILKKHKKDSRKIKRDIAKIKRKNEQHAKIVIGGEVLRVLGCDWCDVDFGGLRRYLEEYSGAIRKRAVKQVKEDANTSYKRLLSWEKKTRQADNTKKQATSNQPQQPTQTDQQVASTTNTQEQINASLHI